MSFTGRKHLDDNINRVNRIVGLDALRLIAAAVVALGHFEFQFTSQLAPFVGDWLAKAINTTLLLAFNGPAAVVVFFVLSGLVIHLPYANGKEFRFAEFAARRYVRIIPPVIVFMIALWLLGRSPGEWDWNDTVLWSVICELIYYTLYPLFRASRIPFLWLTIGATVIAGAVAILNWGSLTTEGTDYMVFGYWTFIIGLPAWLMGCLIAEYRSRVPVVSVRTMWVTRSAIYFASVVIRVVKFHGLAFVGAFASNVFLLSLFAVPVALWLALESRFYEKPERETKTLRALEVAGAASFSLYLVHPLVLLVLALVMPLGDILSFVIYLAAATAGTIAFYYAIERPCHILARKLGSRIKARASVTV